MNLIRENNKSITERLYYADVYLKIPEKQASALSKIIHLQKEIDFLNWFVVGGV